MTEEWISLREFARRRPVSLGAVQKAIDSGRVTAVRRKDNKPDGRIQAIEYHAATAQWNGNTDIDQAQRAGAPVLVQASPPSQLALDTSAPPSAQPAGSSPAGAAPAADGNDSRYLAARATKQEYEAKQAELNYATALGQLVSSDELRRVNSQRYRALRDKLLNIADRISTVVAAERDPARVHVAITAELKRVLNELADDAAAEAARGAEERVAA